MIDSEALFCQLLVASKQRSVDFEDVLAHELKAILPSLFHDDGNMCKITKSNLLKRLKLSCNGISHNLKEDRSTAYTVYWMPWLCYKE